MRIIFVVIFQIILIATSFGQSHKEEVLKHQEQLNKQYKSKEESPLSKKKRRKFKNHNFFEIDANYRIEADFEIFEEPESFKMKTSTERTPTYRKYGVARFELDGEKVELIVYQSVRLLNDEEYKDYLFLPFKDATSGKESYGGGRYIDLKIPEGNKIIIDFNKSYNPYCAYSYGYSCPIPPIENHLEIPISAGIQFTNDNH